MLWSLNLKLQWRSIIVEPNPDRNELKIRVNYNVPKLDVTQSFDFDVLLVARILDLVILSREIRTIGI